MKAVVFDFYNTLAETPGWAPAWEQVIVELGFRIPPEVRERWWSDAFDGTEHDEHSRSRDHYVAWQQSRIRSMLDECGIPDADHDTVITSVHEISGHRRIEAYREVTGVLAALRRDGFTLAICSNWDWDLAEAIETAGLTGAVDVIVSSAWVGARKPHTRIYAHTLEQIGVAAHETVFVGDTWSCDVDGPRAAGMRSVYLRREHLGPDRTAPPPDERPPDVHHATDLDGVVDAVRAVQFTLRSRPSQ